jgi:hypothetical protein
MGFKISTNYISSQVQPPTSPQRKILGENIDNTVMFCGVLVLVARAMFRFDCRLVANKTPYKRSLVERKSCRDRYYCF